MARQSREIDPLESAHLVPIEDPLRAESVEHLRDRWRTEYDQNIQILNRMRLLEADPTANAIGVRSENGTFYNLPSFETIWSLYEKKAALIDEKRHHGFRHLQLTPFALPFHRFASSIEHELQQLSHRKTLYGPHAGTYHDDPIFFEASDDHQFMHLNSLTDAHKSNQLFYFPQRVSSNHPGISKAEYVDRSHRTQTPGWSIGLLEQTPTLPRPLREAWSPSYNFHSIRNFKELWDPWHICETGFTVEDFLTLFSLQLIKTNELCIHWFSINLFWTLENRVTSAWTAEKKDPLSFYWDHEFDFLTVIPSAVSSNNIHRTLVRLEQI